MGCEMTGVGAALNLGAITESALLFSRAASSFLASCDVTIVNSVQLTQRDRQNITITSQSLCQILRANSVTIFWTGMLLCHSCERSYRTLISILVLALMIYEKTFSF